MRDLFHVAAFWLVVVVAVRLAVCFPRSALARILFLRVDPLRRRHESYADHLVRCALFGFSFFLQAACLFAAGWLAIRWHAPLGDSLFFVVLWAVVIPLLGGAAAVGALFALARSVWLRRCARPRRTASGSARADQA